MKNKKIIIILSSLVILLGGIFLVNKIYNKPKNKLIPKKNNLAIMVKGESGEYISSDAIPKGNYILNEEKTICENGGKVVSYNNSTGQIGFSFLGSDRCSLYFDKIIDTEKPVISNLSVNDTTVTATLTDNMELSGYGISTSNSTEPTSWTTISGTTYNLSTTITTEGTYYLWVKDSAGNKAVSEVIDLEKKGYQTILINNGGGATTVDTAINYIKGKGTPNFANTATTNEGMYAAEDDLGTSYYFRGAVNNNWVKFGKDSSNKDMYWRIIRINGDGSIRMIYSGTTAPTSSTATVMTGTGTQIGTSKFNSNYNNPAYVGYMYTANWPSNMQHGTRDSSTIKNYIENWYKDTSLVQEDMINLISNNTSFCNDRVASTSRNGTYGEINESMDTSKDYYYNGYKRIVLNKTPSLKCQNEIDKFTINSNDGNSLLTYPVGLIMVDEVMLAGSNGNLGTGSYNSSFYLYTNQFYWTFSPQFYIKDGNYKAFVFYLCLSGGISTMGYDVSGLFGVRPVISLSSKVKLSGDGTYNNIYAVS